MKQVNDKEVNSQVAYYHPYKPFSDWPNVNDDKFEDVIHWMTNLDSQKQATAREVLEHPWFAGCELY
ncbi:predicted protein [Histoplasma mississippiense (nom. inval.)]|uniref:predicted protein n=1 Tax=Ajellomyces capsulatus (strain NAm1 / WU24) TaxID=2059318 RepID=UPI000157D22D|nr:predicted protein [Histoplasma mississippiense (nom. inval.)]EDN04855.1 predicted protein [Histoplasma mississippiense (nom. inval.)]